MGRAHDTDSLDCWCKPQLLLPCDECQPPFKEKSDGGCWKCGGKRLIECSRFEAEESPFPVLIIHRDIK